MKEEIKIKYDGDWPNLCSGHLEVWVGETYYDFGKYVLCSGGRVVGDEDWNMWTEEGPWIIYEEDLPKDFPVDRYDDLMNVINAEIPWGCCGGCI
jgi:hypothetical protein